MDNKPISLPSGRQLFYRDFDSERSMVVVFDAATGLQIGNYDIDVFEANLSKSGNLDELDTFLAQLEALTKAVLKKQEQQ